jgi:hypothetical protein
MTLANLVVIFSKQTKLETDEWTTVSNIINGEYSNPMRMVAFMSEPAKKFVECVLGAVVR